MMNLLESAECWHVPLREEDPKSVGRISWVVLLSLKKLMRIAFLPPMEKKIYSTSARRSGILIRRVVVCF